MGFYPILVLLIAASVSNGEFLGKFIFHGNDDNQDQTAFSIYHKPDSVHFAPTPGPLPSNEISSVLSLSLGLSIPKDITWNGLLAGSLFDRPKAAVMLSVENLPKDSTLKTKAVRNMPVKVTDDATKIGEVYSMSSKQSITSHVNQIMGGKSSTLSISADEDTAAFGFSRGDHSKTAFWSDMTNSWRIVDGQGKTSDSLTKHGIYKRIAAILPNGFKHDNEGKKVIVNHKDVQVNFDLKNHADFKLFSELVFMKWQFEQLAAKKSLINDGAPDVYLLSVSALKDLEVKHGENSKQIKAALLLLESFIPQIVSDYKTLYRGDVLIVGFNTQSEASDLENHHTDVDNILKSLKTQFGHEFEHIVPELHSQKNVEKSIHHNLCGAVQGAIARFAPSLKFKCHNDEESAHKVYRRSLMATAANPGMPGNLASKYDSMFPVIFNIWFWLLVVIALATYSISVAMWNMDPGRDSIIYRLTEQRIKNE